MHFETMNWYKKLDIALQLTMHFLLFVGLTMHFLSTMHFVQVWQCTFCKSDNALFTFCRWQCTFCKSDNELFVFWQCTFYKCTFPTMHFSKWKLLTMHFSNCKTLWQCPFQNANLLTLHFSKCLDCREMIKYVRILVKITFVLKSLIMKVFWFPTMHFS